MTFSKDQKQPSRVKRKRKIEKEPRLVSKLARRLQARARLCHCIVPHVPSNAKRLSITSQASTSAFLTTHALCLEQKPSTKRMCMPYCAHPQVHAQSLTSYDIAQTSPLPRASPRCPRTCLRTPLARTLCRARLSCTLPMLLASSAATMPYTFEPQPATERAPLTKAHAHATHYLVSKLFTAHSITNKE